MKKIDIKELEKYNQAYVEISGFLIDVGKKYGFTPYVLINILSQIITNYTKVSVK